MIQCKECGFSVNEMMRFALMKNICPSCGSNLLTGQDANIISVIQSRFAAQRFSSSLTENQLYDISLFVFNELKHEFGAFASQLRGSKPLPKRRPISQAEEESEELEDSDEVSEESNEDDLDLESVRRQVAREIEFDFPEQESEKENEDVDSKAERLKRLYQQRQASGGIPEVKSNIKRGTGFKGVTRST